MNFVLSSEEEYSEEEEEEDRKSKLDSQISQTDLTCSDIEQIITSLEVYEKRSHKQINEIQRLIEQNFDLKAENTEYAPIKGKIKKLESQNSVLKEKSIDRRRENDMLVEKIQKLQKRLSSEQAVRVSVTEYEETDTDDAFLVEVERPAEIDFSPSRKSPPISPGIGDEYFKLEEKRFQEAGEKIMRLEQRVLTLQNANKLNSCATCGPLRNHVITIEKQLTTLVQERRGQLAELFELKQEALSSSVSEKDAHLAWLEVTGEGNIHTRGTIERLRKERRELLNRMKEENENRMRILTNLEDSTGSLLTGSIKMSTLGSYGDLYVSDGENEEAAAEASGQPQSPTRGEQEEEQEDGLSVKSL